MTDDRYVYYSNKYQTLRQKPMSQQDADACLRSGNLIVGPMTPAEALQLQKHYEGLSSDERGIFWKDVRRWCNNAANTKVAYFTLKLAIYL